MRKLYCRLAVLMAERDPQLTQQQLSRETGIAESNLSKLRNNKFSRVDAHTIETLCDYFGCEVGDLLVLKDEAQ